VESFGAHPVLQEVRKPPRGLDPVPRDQIRDAALTHFSLEARVLLLEQLPAYSDGPNFQTSFSAGSSYRTSLESHIFADLSVHASDLLSSSDHGYIYVI
jgi:hypothetical protein